MTPGWLTGDEADLTGAVEDAVAEGLDILRDLTTTTLAAYGRGIAAVNAAVEQHGDRAGYESLLRLRSAVATYKGEATERLERQHERLKTFNIVLFGRTGAGKSSLIAALSGGDGEQISQGESDWTTEVAAVGWAGCSLYDTPGIGGWGRTMAREKLEERAEQAVADADVVMLCFDTQSQQEGEFGKVSEWVSRYGKPVVAVLNSRNSRWRFPTRVPTASARRQLSRSVHEHAGNIRDELARVGLPNVPVVAVHTKRAAFARTSDPYGGPDTASRQKLRTEEGPDRLLAWSNLPALERLFAEALRSRATELRLGMLHEQTRGLLASAAESLDDDYARAATRQAEESERGIDDLLRLFGRPRSEALQDAITELEELRHGGFAAAADGELHRHARARLAAGLRRPRAEALRTADELVDRIFVERRDLDGDEFDRTVFGEARRHVEAVVASVHAELADYVNKRVQRIVEDVALDLQAAQSAFGGAKGAAGKARRWAGIGLGAGAAGGSVVMGAIMVGAALNWWNPIGWTAIGVATAAQIVSQIGGFFLRRKAARAREEARADARRDARRNVTEAFDAWEQSLTDAFYESFATAAVDQIATSVDATIAVRRVALAARATAHELATTGEGVPSGGHASTVLSETAAEVQRRQYPGEPTADRLLWLGESWCTDPHGLTADEGTAEPARTRAYDEKRGRRLADRMRRFAARAGRRPRPGSGRAWLGAAAAALAADPDGLDQLRPLSAVLDAGRPRLVIAGDYSSGKSSFIKRLLLDAGEPVPPGLNVAGSPETAEAATYSWGQWDLVDTPGFQSSNVEHEATAHEAILGASVVVVLFNPNLVVGDQADLRAVLHGVPEIGRVPKLPRSLLVINRSDELGVDPHDDPDAYDQLCARKELELRQAIASLAAVEPEEGQVTCTASDPYGLVGDRVDVSSADYDAHRAWDGIAAFHRAIAQHSEAFHNGVDVAILEAGSARLGRLVADRRGELEALARQLEQQQRLQLDLDACLTSGRALRDAARERLVGAVCALAAELYDDVMQASEPHTRHVRAQRLENLDRDKDLADVYRGWTRWVESELDAWRASTAERIERRLNAASFRAAFPTSGQAFNVAHLKPGSGPTAGAVVRDVGGVAADAAANVGRDTVYAAAKQAGVKFRPWGATKLAGKVNVAGGVFGIGFGAYDGFKLLKGIRQEKRSDEAETRARAQLLRDVRAAAERSFDDPKNDRAPAAVIDNDLDTVTRVHTDVSESLRIHTDADQKLRDQINGCEVQMTRAQEAL